MKITPINISNKMQIAVIIATSFILLLILYYTGLIHRIMNTFINPTTLQYRLTSPFGYRVDPITGKKGDYHNGEDYAAPMGTSLFAPADGIATISNHPSGGLQVVIKHTNGFSTGYAHLNDTLISNGAKIVKGQLFAHTGNSGASTGPHLHLTMRTPAGNRIAPSTYFYK